MSILDPLLFLIYVNDLPCVSDMLFTVMFADDASMFVNGDNLSTLETQLNSELNMFPHGYKQIIYPWMLINHVYCLQNCQEIISRSEYMHKSKKLSKAIASMCMLKAYVTQETMCSLYYSLVNPYLTYCNVVWGNTFKTHLKPLISLQRKTVRCLNFRNHNEFGIDALMLELTLIKFCDLNKYLTCLFMYKLNSGNVPNVITHHFTINNSVHDNNTRLSRGFHVPKLEMIMENELYITMVVCYGTKLFF